METDTTVTLETSPPEDRELSVAERFRALHEEETRRQLEERVRCQTEARFAGAEMTAVLQTARLSARPLGPDAQGLEQLRFTLRSEFAYRGAPDVATEIHWTVCWNPALSPEEALARIRASLEAQMDSFAALAVKDLPVTEDWSRREGLLGLEEVTPEQMERLRDLFDRTADRMIPHLQEAILADTNRHLASLQETNPPGVSWARPGKATACRLRCALGPNLDVTVRCALDTLYAHLSADEAEDSTANLYLNLRQVPESRLEACIEARLTRLAWKTAQTIQDSLAPWELCEPRGEEREALPPGFWTALSTGVARFGKITVHLGFSPDRCRSVSRGGIVIPVLDRDGDAFLAGLPLTEGPRTDRIPLGLGEQPASSSLIPLLDLFAGLARNYEALPLEEGTIRMPVSFHLIHGEPWLYEWNGERQRLERENRELYRRDPNAWAAWFLMELSRKEYDLRHETEAQLRELGRLNPCQLAILQRVYEQERSWRNDLVDAIKGNGYMPASAIPHFLQTLSAVTLPVKGVPHNVIQEKPAWSSHGNFTLYLPDPEIPKELILRAAPRGYDRTELPRMTQAGRRRRVLELAKESRTPQERLDALDLLRDEVSPGTASGFLRSEEGHTFLRSLRGPTERERARTLLAGLPGCQRLALHLPGDDPPEPAPRTDTTS